MGEAVLPSRDPFIISNDFKGRFHPFSKSLFIVVKGLTFSDSLGDNYLHQGGTLPTKEKVMSWRTNVTYLNTVGAAMRHGGGGSSSCRSRSRPRPKPIQPDQKWDHALRTAFHNRNGSKIDHCELRQVLLNMEVSGNEPLAKKSSQAESLRKAVKENLFADNNVANVATRIANGDHNALKGLLNDEHGVAFDQALNKAFVDNPQNHITKAAAKEAIRNFSQYNGGLNADQKNMLKNRANQGQFATLGTQQWALAFANGKLNPAQAGVMVGRAGC